MSKIAEYEQKYDWDIISRKYKYIGAYELQKSYYSDLEILTLLRNQNAEDQDRLDYLEISKDRNGFEDSNLKPVRIDGLKCSDIKSICAHPNMTEDWNHLIVVMD